MLSVVNSILIATTVLVLIYVLLNIKNELTAFKGIYNKEQDYKHTRLQKTFSDIDNNEQQLKGKADEHSTTLESHGGRLSANETKLAEHDTTLSVHDTKLIENRTIIDSNQNLLKNSDSASIQNIVTSNPDVAENDVYSLIGHNNKLIDDNYTTVLSMLEKDTSNNTIIKSENGKVKININNREDLEVCDINGENCFPLISRNFLNNMVEVSGITIPDEIEYFEVGTPKRTLKLNQHGELCVQGQDGNVDVQSCKKIGLLGELQGPPGPQGTPGGAFSDLTPLEKAGLKGDTGLQGLQGIQGERGPQGLTGPKGNKGDAGAQGPQGTQGNPGNTGNTGPKGDIGPQGPHGPKGDIGPQGIPGANSKDCTTKKNCDKLCIGTTCIYETDLKRLKGEHPVYITHYRGRTLQGINNGRGNARFANRNKGSWERMFLK